MSRDRARLAAAPAASPRAPVRRRHPTRAAARTHTHARRTRAHRRDRELRFPFCLFFACVLRTVLCFRGSETKKKRRRGWIKRPEKVVRVEVLCKCSSSELSVSWICLVRFYTEQQSVERGPVRSRASAGA